MIRKIIALAIAVFMAVLFLSTIGSFYTGNAVLDTSKITLADYPYPFVKNNVYNDLYIVIPSSNNAAEYSAAVNVANSLKTTQPIYPRIVTLENLPKEEHNLILVGNPCNNFLITEELETTDCNLNLKQKEGLLKLINYESYSILIVSGYDHESLNKAALVLANYNNYPLRGNEVVVLALDNDLVLNYH